MACRSVNQRRLLAASCSKIFSKQQVRTLSLYEYQSQDLLRQYGVSVPRGKIARTPKEASDAAEALGGKCIIKSQISRGGRAKGRFDSGLQGGIQLVDSPQAAQDMAAKMLGNRLITKQTSDVGIPVQEVYVAERLEYKDELYLAMTVDRDSYRPAIILSKSGGVDIECVAKEDAGALRTFHFDMSTGITADVASDICSFLELSAKESENMRALLESMYRVFSEGDAIMLEVNPLVRRADGSLTCIGAKFTFDDAAAKRQKDLFALRLSEQEVPDEIEAAKWGLVYVRMDGNIGNVVNGAGLAMATNDAISLYGGSSANFLDAGGQATKETMVKAFSIVLNDKRVTTILVNIYGGIIDGRMIAESIIAAAAELGPMRVPVVVRLQGTNSEAGLKLLEKSNLGLHIEAEFGAAAQLAVKLASGGN